MRQAARFVADDQLSETKKFQYEYWTKFRNKLEMTKKITTKLQPAKPQYWFDFALGKSGVLISNVCNSDQNWVGIRIYIQNKVADTMLLYLRLAKMKKKQH